MPALATCRVPSSRAHRTCAAPPAPGRPSQSRAVVASAASRTPDTPAPASFLASAGQALATAALAASLLVGELRVWEQERENGGGAHALFSPSLAFSATHTPTQLSPSTSSSTASPAAARLEGVNKPELLPPGPPVPVLDVAGFLTPGEKARLTARVEALQADTGVRLRVLAQNYPQTPGLAIKDYWAVDGDTVVFVADPNTGNILNFNVGDGVDLRVPRSFWSRLASKFGTKRYWQEAGQEAAIVNAVNAIDLCLREPMGVGQCVKVADSVM
jgi:hypothetical protein